MPALHHAGIRVRLGTTSLEQTLTPHVVHRKGDVAAKQVEKADVQLRRGAFLEEECVHFPGEYEPFEMHWLGDAPFLMAKVADPFKEARDGKKARNGGVEPSDGSRGSPLATPRSMQASEQPQTESVLNPKALVLHIMLTNKTFYDSIRDGSHQHIKIDVFLNGELSSCVLVHQADIRAGAKSLHQIFAGTRVDYMAERPWVIHPPSVDDGTVHDMSKTENATSRWNEICQALLVEANARGANADGERPPSAQYLARLARMQMPPGVCDLQKPGRKTFGVVDVIVTVGLGKKLISGSGYLKTPRRLHDEGYSFKVDEETRSCTKLKKRHQRVISKGQARVQEKEIVQLDGPHYPGAPSNGQGLARAEENGSSAPTHSSDAHIPSSALPSPTFQIPFTSQPIPNLVPSSLDIYNVLPMNPTITTEKFQAPTTGLHKGFHDEAIPKHQVLSTVQGPQHASFQGFPSTPTPTSTNEDERTLTIAKSKYILNPYSDQFNPYQLPFSGMMADFDMSGPPSSTVLKGHISSPLRGQASEHFALPTFNEPSSPLARHMQIPKNPSESNPCCVSASETKGISASNSYTNHDPCNYGTPFTQNTTTSGFPLQALHVLGSGGGSNSPLAQNTPTRRQQQPYLSLSDLTQQSPRAPIGFFKSTPKPKSTSRVTPRLVVADQNIPDLFVRRLIITGRDGVPVVDYRWKTPQRILTSRGKKRLRSVSSASRSVRESFDPTSYEESLGRSRRNMYGAPASFLTPVLSSKATATIDAKRDSVHDGPSSTLAQYMQDKLPELFPRGTVAVGKSQNAAFANRNLPKVDARRTAPASILGVQGPKANVFVLDDPEELLRRKRAQSRSVSPSKGNAKHRDLGKDPPGQGRETFEKDGDDEMYMITDDSPLSSVPVSPTIGDHNGDSVLSLNPEDLSKSFPTSSYGSMSQFSSSSLPPPTTSEEVSPSCAVGSKPAYPAARRKTRASIALPPSTSTDSSPLGRRSSMPPPSTPASGHPRRGSRPETHGADIPKTRAAAPARQPRRVEQLDTTGNPPLSQNCVIQLAENEKTENGATGAPSLLRQVKCERQGVFAEESVVVGVRFFVGA